MDLPFSNLLLDTEVEKEVRSQKLKTAGKIHSILEKIKEFEKNASLLLIQNVVTGMIASSLISRCLLIFRSEIAS
jgi:hypothetical protein